MTRKLTDHTIRGAEPQATKYTMPAGKGLTLLVMPDGAKYWRLRYRFGGKSRWLSVGRPYPETVLREAEAEAARFRAMIVAGNDPAEVKRTARLAERKRVANNFGEAAEAWHAFRSQSVERKDDATGTRVSGQGLAAAVSRAPIGCDYRAGARCPGR